MALENQNITVWKGNKIVIPYYIEGVTTLIDFTAEWSMASTVGSSKILTKTTAVGGGITIDGLAVLVEIDPEDTDQSSSLNAGNYYMELCLWDVNGDPFTVSVGTLVLKDVLIKE